MLTTMSPMLLVLFLVALYILSAIKVLNEYERITAK